MTGTQTNTLTKSENLSPKQQGPTPISEYTDKKFSELSNKEKYGLLDEVLINDDLSAFQYLIHSGEFISELDCSNKKHNWLFWAIIYNSSDVLKYIANPENKILETFKDDTTYLHAAAATCQHETVMQILKKDPDKLLHKNCRDEDIRYWATLGAEGEIANPICQDVTNNDVIKISDYDSSQRAKFDYHYNVADTIEDKAEILAHYNSAAIGLLVVSKHTDNDYLNLAMVYFKYASNYLESTQYQPHVLFQARAYLVIACSHLSKLSHDYRCKNENKVTRINNNICDLLKIVTTLPLSDLLKSESNKWGFSCTFVAPDGDCFFNAVLDQLALLKTTLNNHNSVAQLRMNIGEHILEFKDSYSPYIDMDKYSTVEEYVERMAKDEWADHTAIQAYARIYKLNIAIINSDGTQPIIFRTKDATVTLHLGYDVKQRHYWSLKKNPELTPDAEHSIEKYVTKTEIDTFDQGLKHETNAANKTNEESQKRKLNEYDIYINPGKREISDSDSESDKETKFKRLKKGSTFFQESSAKSMPIEDTHFESPTNSSPNASN